MSDFILILYSLYCCQFDDPALVLGVPSEKDKNNRVKLVSWKVKLFSKIKFLTTFTTVIDIQKVLFIT